MLFTFSFRITTKAKPVYKSGSMKFTTLDRIIALPRRDDGKMDLNNIEKPPSIAPELPGRGIQETEVNKSP